MDGTLSSRYTPEMPGPDPRPSVLRAVSLITFLVALEGTVVSPAIPQTVRELQGGENLSWVFSAYLAGLAITGPIWGNLADRHGSRRIYTICTLIFLLGSGWAATAHSMNQLIAGRALQGLGGGGLTPLGQTVLSQIYSREERAVAQTWIVSTFGIASLLGPPLGGYLSEHYSWRWVFLLNVPFGLLGLLLLLTNFSPPPQSGSSTRFDWPGTLLFILWMSCTLIWADHLKSEIQVPQSWPWLIGAAVLALLLWFWSRRQSEPFLPLPMLRLPVFRGAVGIAILLGAGLFGAVTYFPLFLQSQFRLNSESAGAAMLPLLLSWTGSSAVAPRLAIRWGYAPLVGTAAAALLVAYFCLATGQQHRQVVFVAQLGLGLAGGLSFSPLTLAIQELVPPAQLGQATAAIVFLRTLGATLGTALMGAALHASGFPIVFRLGLIVGALALLSWSPFRRALRS